MKKGLILLMTIALMTVMVGVGYAAVFNDTETVAGNSFTAGSLDLKIDGLDNPEIDSITVTNMKPGDTITKVWKVENVGTLDGQMKVKIENISSDDNACTEPENVAEVGEFGAATCGVGQGELGYFFRTKVFKSPSHNIHQSASHCIKDIYHLGMPQANFIGGIYRAEDQVLQGNVIPANDYSWVKLQISLDENIWRRTKGWPGVPDYDVDDNLVQTDSVTFDIVFELVQTP